VERLDLLGQLAADGARSAGVTAAMLAPPLLARQWDAGFATLFTAAYRPATGRLDYHWPGRQVSLQLDRALPDEFEVALDG
jgi:hypothetical protein